MLTEHDLRAWFVRNATSPQARALIERVRSSPPSREVASTRRGVSGRYASQKMGRTIQFESQTGEQAAVYEMEHDLRVLEYWDQPPPIKLNYLSLSGRSLGILHTPDFFVIEADGAGWAECKPEAQLRALAKKMLHRYVRDEDGEWRCPPGEAYAEQFGLFYRVLSDVGINWVFQRNLRFLEDYFNAGDTVVAPDMRERLLALVATVPGITPAELLGGANGFTAGDIYALIASEALYVDLHAAPLAEPDRVHVFRDRDTAAAYTVATAAQSSDGRRTPRSVVVAPGTAITWDARPWMILNTGETTVTLADDLHRLIEVPIEQFEALVKTSKISGFADQTAAGMSPEGRERLIQASREDLAEANRRYACIAPCLRGLAPGDPTVPGRTKRQWLAQFRVAEAKYGCGYIGLLPRLHDRGRRDRRLPQSTLELIDESITLDYETLRQRRKRVAHGFFLRRCEERGITPCSYRTYLEAIRRRPREEQIRRRRGDRAAYQHQAFYWELTLTTPRHGDRPFEIAHIDHTQLDIELVHSATRRPLGRPWVTFLVDAVSRRVLSVYLSFAPPSMRACLTVLRFCVRDHGRLPQTVIVDGGAEFRGRDFETFLAFYGCTKKTRPGASPRYGAVIERLFGTTNSQFIHTLAANTQLTKEVRVVTKAVDPKRHAVWTLAGLYAALRKYVHEEYDTTDHTALGQSPREAFAQGLLRAGVRPFTLIPYDDDFIVRTLASPSKGTAKVIPSRGVKIHYLYYWCDAFRDPEVERTQVPVQYDPMDAGTAYAYVRGRWVQCVSEYYARFHGRSEHEVQLASEELRRQHTVHGQSFTMATKKLAEFLASVDVPEAVATARLRDGELRQALQIVGDDRLGRTQTVTRAADSSATEELEPTLESGHPTPEQVPDEPEERQLYKEYK